LRHFLNAAWRLCVIDAGGTAGVPGQCTGIVRGRLPGQNRFNSF
jgi:hypothetical protein